MSFMEQVNRTLNNEFNHSVTENGVTGYRTTGKELVDMNFAVASLRSEDVNSIIDRFVKVYYENPLLAIKWMFYARDIREGLGERRLFRILITYLGNDQPKIINNLIKYIPEYGRWDDMLVLLELTGTRSEVINVIKKQFESDLKNMEENQPISLMAKWLPNITASKSTKKIAVKLAKALGLTEKQYRKTTSKLRKYLKVVEIQMSSGQWNEINYEAVPSKANLLYKNAFMRHDEIRRSEYLEKLEKGEAKINSGVSFPHDIVHKYTEIAGWSYNIRPYDATLEGMWKSLPDLVQGDDSTIVVADGSGSMTCNVDPNSSVTALEVANGLAIYFAEKCKGEFKDKYITFSERPQMVNMTNCKSFRDKLELSMRYSEVADTNIEAVFDLILTTARNNNMSQNKIPKNILIISDMEFNQAVKYPVNERLFETINRKFVNAGYKMPRLVFWNVNSRTGTIPVKENDLGVALVSGFSPNIVKMVLSGETDPYKLLVNELMSERYSNITI